MKIKFEMERATKNTIRFTEEVGPMDTPVIGTLYVQKHALKSIGYKEGQQLVVTIDKVEIEDMSI